MNGTSPLRRIGIASFLGIILVTISILDVDQDLQAVGLITVKGMCATEFPKKKSSVEYFE